MATTHETPAADDLMTLEIEPEGLDRFLELLGERSNPLIKYRHGKVLLVSPGETHERAVQRLDLFLMAVSSALKIKVRGYRSTLFRKPGLDHGVMPDLSYYIQHEASVRRIRGGIDLDTSPPPDLAIEVVVSHRADLAMSICLELGVPEVWTWHVIEERLTFWRMRRTGTRAGEYAEQDRSLAFPFLKLGDMTPWLDDSDVADSIEFGRIQRWARATLGPRRRR